MKLLLSSTSDDMVNHWFHIALAVLTFAIVCIAALQAVLLHMQDTFLRRYHHTNPVVNKLPPLETMEKLLFRTIFLGVVLLSILFISSVYYFDHIFQPPLLQKTLLTLVAWVVFAILLVGRFFFGWRGRKAVFCTLVGFFLLIVIYFSSFYVVPHIQ